MKIDIKILSPLIVLILVTLGCENAKTPATEDENGDNPPQLFESSSLVGTWLFEGPRATLTYTFRGDGTATLLEIDDFDNMEREVDWWLDGNVLYISSQSTEDGAGVFYGVMIYVSGDRLFVEILTKTSSFEGLDGSWVYMELEGGTTTAEDGADVEQREEWSFTLDVQGDRFESVEKIEYVEIAGDGTRQIIQEDSITGDGTLRSTEEAVYLTYEQASLADPFYVIGEEQLLGLRVNDDIIVFSDNPEDTLADLCFVRVE
jgi:hypothetical protein